MIWPSRRMSAVSVGSTPATSVPTAMATSTWYHSRYATWSSGIREAFSLHVEVFT